MAEPADTCIHATSVAIGRRAVLLMGPSGSGKSDLALRLIDRGAVLVSDDYTALSRADDMLLASPPQTIAGKMEIRHIGIVHLSCAMHVPVALAIMLEDRPERMPDELATATLLGVEVPRVALPGLEASAPIKVERALDLFGLKVGG